MSQLKVNTIRHTGASSDAVTLASDGTCTVKATNNLSNRNLIINGSVIISQRKGTSNTTIGSGATYGPDRIAARTQTGSGHTLAQVSDGPDGFKNSAKVTIGTGGSPAAANRNYIYQTVEGYNIAHLGLETSWAKKIAISFWVKSSVTGTFACTILSGTGNDNYTFSYTISSANTWEKKTKILQLPTSAGGWGSGNSAGFSILWDLGSGSDHEGTLNTWGNGYTRNSSNTKLMETNGATWYLTGIQIEEGDVATDFEHRSYGEELARCQRYYFQESYTANYELLGYATIVNTGAVEWQFFYPVSMRATPTVTNNGVGNFRIGAFGNDATVSSFSASVERERYAILRFNRGGTAMTVGNMAGLNTEANNDAVLYFSSEL